MLIRISGGDSGIEDYLEHGQKQGRENSRDELDERAILDGDLDTMRLINDANNSQGEKYLHITLSFKEDEINRETLEAITQDFKSFAFSAYESDEYAFYAEAHIPRIKSYINSKNGEFVERKPHIHIVIPQKNLLSGTNLNPFGKIEQQIQFIDAFQELTNAKYGLSSPKDNRRTAFNMESEMVSRYKGDDFTGRDVFTGHHKDLKAKILADLLEKQIDNKKDFIALLSEYGSVRVRNQGRSNEYLNIKPNPEKKGINLKDYVFTSEFLALSAEQKRQALTKVASAQYEKASHARTPAADYQATLQDWHDRRAKEIKYLNSGNRKHYAQYKQGTPEERTAMLAEKENHFYAKHKQAEDHDRNDKPDRSHLARTLERIRENLGTIDRHIQSASRAVGNLDRAGGNLARRRASRAIAAVVERFARHQGSSVQRPGRTAERNSRRDADNVTGQLKRDHQEHQANTRSTDLSEFQEIRRYLDAQRLLTELSHSHGVIAEKYSISKGKDGGDRIKAGTRNLNVSDFLTKELNLPWAEASKILRDSYQAQTGREHQPLNRTRPRERLWEEFRQHMHGRPSHNKTQWDIQKQIESSQKKAIREVFYAKRGRIMGDRSLRPVERKAQLSIARMAKIQQEQALREAIRQQRAELKKSLNRPLKDEYVDWLTSKSQQGDAEALGELRRMQAKAKETTHDQEIHTGSAPAEQEAPALLAGHRLSYQVHQDGAVTYRRDHQDVVRDEGRFVKVLQTQDRDIETGLRLAQAKFGRKLDIKGTDAFKAAVARIAAEKGLYVEFTEPKLNTLMAQRRAELQQARTRSIPPAPRPQAVKTIESVAPETNHGRYTGSIVSIDARYVYQDHGKEIIRHDIERFASTPAPGERLQIVYRNGQMQAERVQEKGRTRGNER
jgi:Large polyvalent protein-associated domain 7